MNRSLSVSSTVVWRSVACGIAALAFTLSSCAKRLTSTAAPLANMPAAISKAIVTTQNYSPHVVNAATITSDYRAPKDRVLRALNRVFEVILPTSFAATAHSFGDTYWDPELGSYVLNGDLSFFNTYAAGNLYGCDGGTTGSATPNASGPCHAPAGYNFYYKIPNGTLSSPASDIVPLAISSKSWFGQILDPTFVDSYGDSPTIYGRVQSELALTCALGSLITTFDADGTPTAGSYTITLPDTSSVVFKSPAAGGCGLAASMAEQSLGTATVAAVTGSTSYTKQITFNTPELGILVPNTVWLGLNLAHGNVNFMLFEDFANSGSNAIGRTMLSATGLTAAKTTNLRFEYFSMGFNGARGSGLTCYGSGFWFCKYELDRIFIDGANDVAYLLNNTGDPGDASGNQGAGVTIGNATQYAVAGRPLELSACTATSCAETLAISLGAAGTYLPPGDYNACVRTTDRVIATDGSLACSATGVTLGYGAATGPVNLIEKSRQFLAGTTTGTPNLLPTSGVSGATGATTTLSFTGASDFYTAATAQ